MKSFELKRTQLDNDKTSFTRKIDKLEQEKKKNCGKSKEKSVENYFSQWSTTFKFNRKEKKLSNINYLN